jgi:hypothetical protein
MHNQALDEQITRSDKQILNSAEICFLQGLAAISTKISIDLRMANSRVTYREPRALLTAVIKSSVLDEQISGSDK